MMPLRIGLALAVLVAGPAMTGQATEQTDASIAAAYDRSAQFLPWNKTNMIVDDDIQATWIGDSHQIGFKLSAGKGWRFMIADADTGARREAFDHKRLASALGTALGTSLDPDALPLSAFFFPAGFQGPIGVKANGRAFTCDVPRATCRDETPPDRLSDQSYSKSGPFAVFTRDYGLWAREVETGVERRLTKDGMLHYAYAAMAGAASPISRQRLGFSKAPVGSYSPDGTKFLSYRLDERDTPEVTLVQHVPPGENSKPKALTYRSAYPGDPHAIAELYIFDLKTGTARRLEHPPTIPSQRGPVALDQVQWSADGRFVYFVDYADLFRERALYRADTRGGSVVKLIAERSKTSEHSYSNPDFKLLGDGSILWPSERTGWRHLYRYDSKGKLLNAVTSGRWVVRDIIDVDETAEFLVFSAGGREAGDPYLRRVYRIGLDGRGLKLLTPEETDHDVRIGGAQFQGIMPIELPPAFSSDRRFFIDTHSRIDIPTRTVVRRRDGSVAIVLATAGPAHGALNYPLPEPFRAMASDGKTPVYGVIFKPSNFDPAKRYPVIDSIYGGPQAVFTPKTFGREIFGHYGRGLAELGAIVIVMDGRGTPQRERAFQDAGYGHLEKAGFIEDHVAAMRELAKTRPWMDLDRVGAFGYSGGGFAVVHALFDYPEFYKVGVASSTYDPALTNWTWSAQFQGVDDSAALANAASFRNAAQFRGKLLLLTGDLDDVADPSGTMRIADSLIRNNKMFDLLVVPGGDHNITITPYALRRQWDYFARHLIGEEPPTDYRFRLPGEKP